MADYKIANIKWLRDQGWEISSSYADSICPTYNEIVNEIPKSSITVDVNGTCIATSKAYANNQLVCESDITIEPAVDCSVYQFSTRTTPVETHTTAPIAWSIDSLEQLTYTIMSSGGFLTGITIVHTADRWQYMGAFNTTTSSSDRTATIEYKNGDGTCVFPQELVMKGESTIIATLTLNNGSTVDIEGSGALTLSMIESYRAAVTKAEIKNTCTSIGTGAFNSCTSLTSVTIPNSVTSIGGSAFSNCTSLTSVTIPNSVTSIGNGAFSVCSSLTSITFPSSVTNIGGGVLTGITSLERITVERIEPPTIEYDTFVNTNNCPIYVPCESVNTYKNSWSQYASRITCEGGDETYTVYVTSEPNESSCARVLIADGGSIEFTLSIYVGDRTHTLKYLVNNRQEFGEAPKRFGTINVPIGQISSFDFNYLSTDTGNILKANSSSNGNKLPQLTTQWSTLGSNTELWEGGAIPILCTGDENGNRFVVSWDINTVNKTITIYYMYQ